MKKIICILLILLLSGCVYKDCGNDLNCFKQSIKICEKAVVLIDKEGVSVTARIRGLVPGDLCLVSFKVNEVRGYIAEEYPTEAEMAVGKTLNCELNYHLENFDDISRLTENYDRCSGPLKLIIDQHIKPRLDLIKEFNELLI